MTHCFSGVTTSIVGKWYYTYNGKIYSQNDYDDTNDYEVLVQTLGNNDWSTSNIRSWINSDSQNVKYEDSAPISKGMADRMNGYDTEPGFLYGFTDEEKEAILTEKNLTKEYYKSNGEDVVTENKVYLLSKSDVEKMKDEGISIYVTPTEEAIEKNESGIYAQYKEIYNRSEFYWWLREPVEDSPDLHDSEQLHIKK